MAAIGKIEFEIKAMPIEWYLIAIAPSHAPNRVELALCAIPKAWLELALCR